MPGSYDLPRLKHITEPTLSQFYLQEIYGVRRWSPSNVLLLHSQTHCHPNACGIIVRHTDLDCLMFQFKNTV